MSGARVEGEWVVVPQRVLMADTDAMGIVYYGSYLRFLEAGRNELIRCRGGTYREVEARGFQLPVTEAGVKYHRPGRYDDDLEVWTRVEELGRVRLRFAYRVVRAGDGELLAEGFTTHACLEAATGKVVRIPADVRGWVS